MISQEFYDTTIAHLVAQGERARMDDSLSPAGSGCAYRNSKGQKCAAGVHIPDSLYRPEMEGKSVVFLLDNYPALVEHFPNRNLAIELQTLHDTSGDDFSSSRFRERANFIAASSGLRGYFPEEDGPVAL